MDTPSSMETFAASYKQTHDASNSNAKPDRSVLLDITNDSPIVGLAMGSHKTPSSSVAEKLPRRTPGSGETLLRGQVKTLLQKVEKEETETVKSLPLEDFHGGATFRALLGHLRSPRTLLAPTPAITPQIPGLLHPGPAEGDLKIPQVEPIPIDFLNGERPEESQLPRALLFDSPDKSDTSESSPLCSALTYEGSACSFPEKSTDEECSSMCSTVANASSNNGEENGSGCYGDVEVEEDEDFGDSSLDELCQGFSAMSVVERKGVLDFAGRHTRFIYNSDDEIKREEEVGRGGDGVAAASPGVLVLKGLPVPEGKHLRFQEEED